MRWLTQEALLLLLSSVMVSREQSERMLQAVRLRLREVVDDYSGTGPRRWPWPPTLDAARLRPLYLLVTEAT